MSPSCLARASELEVSSECRDETCTSSWFFTAPPPNRHTHYRLRCHPPPTLPFLSPPLPAQACDVTIWDNEVRFLLHQPVKMTVGPGQCAPSLESGALYWLPWAWGQWRDGSLGSPSNALQSGRSRVDLRMTSREWQWLSQPTPTETL